MSEVIIQAEKLSKLYRIGKSERYKTLRDAIASTFTAPLRKLKSGLHPKDTSLNYIWALKDVSFAVKKGEIVGIIGPNGAGKTTLLKILSRITSPSEGYAEVHGRVASLLEIGTGFHPELTGRDNIYLNSAILGMKKQEIRRKFDEIVEFAEIGKFIDTPLKHYSSGMYVRLAFAVAAHLEPEILLVDEVLAVGDAVFQKKCLGKMSDVAGEGRTVLFVSHNMAAVRSLCSRAILLEGGRLVIDADSEEVVTHYLMSAAQSLPVSVDTSGIRRPPELINAKLRIIRIEICNNRKQAIVFCREPLELALDFVVSEPISDVVFGWSVHSVDNVRLFGCNSIDALGAISEIRPGRYTIKTALKHNPLNPGLFSLYIGARCAGGGLEYLPGVMNFQVERAERQQSLWLEAGSGAMSLDSEWLLLTQK